MDSIFDMISIRPCIEFGHFQLSEMGEIKSRAIKSYIQNPLIVQLKIV